MSAQELRDFIANHFEKPELSCSGFSQNKLKGIYAAQRASGGPTGPVGMTGCTGVRGAVGMRGCIGTRECFASRDDPGVCRKCCPREKLIPEDTRYCMILTFRSGISQAEQGRLIDEARDKFPGFDVTSRTKKVVNVENPTPEQLQEYEGKMADWERRKNEADLYLEKARALGVTINEYYYPEKPSKFACGLEKVVTIDYSVSFDGDSDIGKLLSEAGFALDFEH